MSRPTLDQLKVEHDGHLYAGKVLPAREPFPYRTEVDPETGHSFVQLTKENPGVIEYAPKNCACPRCRR